MFTPQGISDCVHIKDKLEGGELNVFISLKENTLYIYLNALCFELEMLHAVTSKNEFFCSLHLLKGNYFTLKVQSNMGPKSNL